MKVTSAGASLETYELGPLPWTAAGYDRAKSPFANPICVLIVMPDTRTRVLNISPFERLCVSRLTGDRRFESVSLQRRVSCELTLGAEAVRAAARELPKDKEE